MIGLLEGINMAGGTEDLFDEELERLARDEESNEGQ